MSDAVPLKIRFVQKVSSKGGQLETKLAPLIDQKDDKIMTESLNLGTKKENYFGRKNFYFQYRTKLGSPKVERRKSKKNSANSSISKIIPPICKQ